MRRAAAVVVCLLASAAFGDEVLLKKGGKLVGKASRVGDEVVVTTPHGETRVKSEEVESITPGRTVWDDYADELKKRDAKDAKAQVALGDWCKDHDLAAESKLHWKKALDLDPDQADARQRLGFLRFDDKWLLVEDYYKARGFVKVDGEWISQDESRRRESVKREREAVKKHEKTIRDCVTKMGSMKRKTRAEGKLALQEYAESIGDLRLASFASEVATFYDESWKEMRRALVQIEVRATMATLKRPIPTITTSLGAGSTPVTIQLPELSIVSVKTTAIVPAEIELDDDP